MDPNSELLKRLLILCPIIDLEEDFHPFSVLVLNCLFQPLYLLRFSVHANLEKVVLFSSLPLCQEKAKLNMYLISVMGLNHVSVEVRLKVSSVLPCFVFLPYDFAHELKFNLTAESFVRLHSTSMQNLLSKELSMLVFFRPQHYAYR